LTREDAARLFDRRRAAWLASDLDAYLELFAGDLVFRSPMHAEPLRGREAFAQLVRRSAAALAPEEFEVTHLATHDDVVLAEWRIAARHRESGQRVEWWGMSVCRIAAGRITDWREYWNPADVAGARPPAPRG